MTSRRASTTAAIAVTLLATIVVSCGDRDPAPEPEATASGTGKSIFRPEFQVEPIGGAEAVAPAPLDTTVRFEEGVELDEQARADIATVAQSPQAAMDWPIILRGHSDSGGSDASNMRASIERAEAVKAFLVENGIAESRITVIGFGEQNPVAPNALPDGSPNERGRAANRRVDIHIGSPDPKPVVEEPTLAETLAEPAEE
ncbi:OmpA family protein [Qipengyuania sp. RANM35]|uniref:OmpA family protein n=1 Tax=Qipengyuania sp. RANM35 TaxID=3068635 RepID=UPI0034DAF6C9